MKHREARRASNFLLLLIGPRLKAGKTKRNELNFSAVSTLYSGRLSRYIKDRVRKPIQGCKGSSLISYMLFSLSPMPSFAFGLVLLFLWMGANGPFYMSKAHYLLRLRSNGIKKRRERSGQCRQPELREASPVLIFERITGKEK